MGVAAVMACGGGPVAAQECEAAYARGIPVWHMGTPAKHRQCLVREWASGKPHCASLGGRVGVDVIVNRDRLPAASAAPCTVVHRWRPGRIRRMLLLAVAGCLGVWLWHRRQTAF